MSSASSPPRLSHAGGYWWRTTNNLLATGVILIVGLAIGREVIEGWWHVRAPETSRATAPLDVRPSMPQLGPWLSEPFAGSQSAAIDHLQQLCKAACAARRPLQPIGTIETSALNAGERLVAYDDYEVYLAEGTPPLMAAVALTAGGAERSVYCWGLALPVEDVEGTNQWNLLISAPQLSTAQEQ